MTKVLIADKMSPRAAEILADRGIEVDVEAGLDEAQLKARIGAYDGLAVRSATKVTKEALESAEALKAIGRAGIGVDNIDVTAATARGILVMNTPFGNSITTAEHAIALMFALARMIPQANSSTHAGKWEKSRFMGVELMGKTLGIIGCGNIGSIVADRAQGLKMKVVAYDPYLAPERAQSLNIEKVELDGLLGRSDFISLHTPLTDATRDIIDAAALAKTRPGVRIINCARGGLVVEADLKTALEDGHVAAAAIDVYPQEPARENILFGMENVVATPHLGASTSEAQEKVAEQVAEQIADYLLTGAVVNALNMPSVSAEDSPRLRPYMKLAEQVGGFLGQIVSPGFTGVRIDYEGDVGTLNTKPLTAIILEGLLRPLMESVNMVNAPVVAKDRGIGVTESANERSADYHSLIRLTLTGGDNERCVAGTLFGDSHPRLVSLDGIAIEAEVSSDMLYVTNEDLPGFIGKLGTALGEADVNIATFHLVRESEGGEALALVSVDQPVPESVLESIRALPLVKQARAIRLA